MTVKLSNDEFNDFVALMNGEDLVQVDAEDEYAVEQRNLVLALFNQMKTVEHQEFAVEPWGYDQINLENVTLIGTYRNSVLLQGKYVLYAVSKSKFNKRESASLDGSRMTLWAEPHSYNEIAENVIDNFYSGH
ncbi:hypothetical protein JOC36_001461 [Weissella uvarum]|uniref:hypothetical protein n=1 Tax=Weissella uvarum TaxID=1479233 RepID=UPI001961734F|nr:hypothetical protein [Weissella uvarum]MBM7617868.1 hypothetical protein [Weissella uvarum]MCM0596134.1 hypothetical protein [Weissella uvarum]